MCSATTVAIDDLALTVEHTIEENETALTEYEEEFTAFDDFVPGVPEDLANPDMDELFS